MDYKEMKNSMKEVLDHTEIAMKKMLEYIEDLENENNALRSKLGQIYKTMGIQTDITVNERKNNGYLCTLPSKEECIEDGLYYKNGFIYKGDGTPLYTEFTQRLEMLTTFRGKRYRTKHLVLFICNNYDYNIEQSIRFKDGDLTNTRIENLDARGNTSNANNARKEDVDIIVSVLKENRCDFAKSFIQLYRDYNIIYSSLCFILTNSRDVRMKLSENDLKELKDIRSRWRHSSIDMTPELDLGSYVENKLKSL